MSGTMSCRQPNMHVICITTCGGKSWKLTSFDVSFFFINAWVICTPRVSYELKLRIEAYISLNYTYVFLLDFQTITVIRTKEPILRCIYAGCFYGRNLGNFRLIYIIIQILCVCPLIWPVQGVFWPLKHPTMSQMKNKKIDPVYMF